MSTMRGLMLGYIKRVWSGQAAEARKTHGPAKLAREK
jgi:hypothetical protein